MQARTELANAIRVLSMDAVEKANSGHPGMPMGMADMAEVLWNDFLQHNPNNPDWINRDRFVVSNGHGSMLLYALLHFSGYADMTMDEIKRFRQLHSKTPGHPEFGYAKGIETTTGPLGQGIANAVGMALAERVLAAQFNKPEFAIVDHYTYAFLGDGCMMEGISHECCSIAGHLGLGKLIAFWDDNGISIDGHVAGWFSDDTPKRFEAYGWHVIRDVNGQDPEAVKQAIIAARQITNKPSLICCKTVIAYGAPNLGGSHHAHGAALGKDEVAAVRANLHWQHPPFEIPTEIYAAFDARERGQVLEARWQALFDRYAEQYPEQAKEFQRRIKGELPADWASYSQQYIEECQQKLATVATRKASENCLNRYGAKLPELLGGSADLTGSNLTKWSGSQAITNTDFAGNYIYYGVREFGMFAIMNGIALHGGFIPYGGTFLTFVDYGRNAVRLAAMMKQRVIFVLTHDSIGLGEDGPTHQPIEHFNILRMTPGLSMWRPCDQVETAVAWQLAIERQHAPTALLFSRQNLPPQHRDQQALAMIAKGGYVLSDCQGLADAIIIATGSEVQLAIAAKEQLEKQGKAIRVVSMPSTDIFDAQPESYRDSVLPRSVKAKVVVEAGSSAFWYKYIGIDGKVIGLDRYGESAPAAEVFKAFGFTAEHVADVVKALI